MRRKEPPNNRANRRVPPDLRSRPREEWRPENRNLPEEYAAWLVGGGISPHTTHTYHVPLIHLVLGGMAGSTGGSVTPYRLGSN